MHNLMLISSFLRPVAKADGHLSIWIVWVAPSWVLVNFGWGRVFMHLTAVYGLVWGYLFVRSIASLFADAVGRGLHQFMYALVQVDVSFVNAQPLSVVKVGYRLVVVEIACTFGSRQVGTGALVKVVENVFVPA